MYVQRSTPCHLECKVLMYGLPSRQDLIHIISTFSLESVSPGELFSSDIFLNGRARRAPTTAKFWGGKIWVDISFFAMDCLLESLNYKSFVAKYGLLWQLHLIMLRLEGRFRLSLSFHHLFFVNKLWWKSISKPLRGEGVEQFSA